MKEILTILFRRRRHFAVFFLLMLVVPMTLAYIVPEKYKAQATVLLTPGRFKKPFLPDEADTRMSFMQVSMEDVGSEVELITSYPVLVKAVEANGLDRDDPPPREQLPKYLAYHALKGLNATLVGLGLKPEVPAREAAIEKLRRKLDVDYVKRTNIITVQWKAGSPALAAAVVNSVVDAYLEQHIAVHGNAYARDAVQKEMAASYERLVRAEDSLALFSKQHAVSEVETQRTELLDKLGEAESKYQLLRNVGQKGLSVEALGTVTGDPALSELSRRLTDAELRRVELTTRYGAEDRKLVALQNESDELRRLARERYDLALRNWKTLAETYRSQLYRLDQTKVDIDRLRREIEDLNRLYLLNREKNNEILISAAMDKATIAAARVVEYATPRTAPSFPNRMLLLVVSLFFATVFGLVYAFAVDRLSGRFLSVSDVEQLAGLPVLASLPEYSAKLVRDGTVAQLVGRDLIPVGQDILRAGQDFTSILVTSPSGGAGTTFVAEHLARQAASGDQGRALLVSFAEGGDGPALREAAVSLASGLEKGASAGYDRLRIALAAADLDLYDNGARRLVERIRQAGYRFVVFDVTARRADAFYLKFLQLADSVLLVVGYDRTAKPALVRMIEQIRRFGGKLSGCVFNLRQNPIPEFLYRRMF